MAGVLSLADACRVVAARARLMEALPPGGAMLAVRATEDEIAPYLTDQVCLAAVNGPESVVVSGDEKAVTALAEAFAARGGKTRRLRVSHAFHSLHMDAMLQDFERVARSVSYAPPKLPLVSNLTGDAVTDAQVCDPGYWVRHVREAVRLATACTPSPAAAPPATSNSAPTESCAAFAQETLDALADETPPGPHGRPGPAHRTRRGAGPDHRRGPAARGRPD
ncbi:acyltransferase domain-containing protein [Streptomyces albidoflavus]